MSMAPLLGLPGKVKTLVDRLTLARAEALDQVTAVRMARLDAAVSTAAAAASYTPERAVYLDLLNTHLDATTGLQKPMFQLLTSGSTWTRPAGIVGTTVYVTGIAGGEAGNGTSGRGGSYLIKWPYAAGATVTYSIGAGGVYSTGGENGGNTVWGTITLIGGGVSAGWGTDDAGDEIVPYMGAFQPTDGASHAGAGGSGLILGGTVYDFGGYIAGGNESGGNGAILLEWWESV